MNRTDLDRFLELVRQRRATRHFRPDPLPDGVLEKLLEAARWAPSGYNLQPTHFVVVTDPALKAALRAACMNQAQVTEAPTVVIFCGDRHVARHHLEPMLAQERDAATMDDRYAATMRRYVRLAFGTGPLGLGRLAKMCLPLLRPVIALPVIPAVHRDFWLGKQAALAAMNFMLAAEAAGLATCPMEGFDPARVRRALGLPRHRVPLLVVPVGHAATPGNGKTRLPIDRLVQYNRAEPLPNPEPAP